MTEYTQEQIDNFAKDIEEMSHEEMARKWRFSPSGDPFFRTDLKTSDGKSLPDIYKERFFGEFGGFNPELSKIIGW